MKRIESYCLRCRGKVIAIVYGARALETCTKYEAHCPKCDSYLCRVIPKDKR